MNIMAEALKKGGIITDKQIRKVKHDQWVDKTAGRLGISPQLLNALLHEANRVGGKIQDVEHMLQTARKLGCNAEDVLKTMKEYRHGPTPVPANVVAERLRVALSTEKPPVVEAEQVLQPG